jgi:hypothetical protein
VALAVGGILVVVAVGARVGAAKGVTIGDASMAVLDGLM